MKLAFISALFLSFASPAYAECSNTAYWSFGGPYLLKDVGLVEAEGVNTQDGYDRSCGKWSFGIWVSYGEPDAAKEVELLSRYSTKIGPFATSFGGEYFALNLHGDSLAKADDDMVHLYADVSYPLTFGAVTVAPLVRFVELIGIDELDSVTLVQPGVRFSVEPLAGFTLSADIRNSMNLTEGYAQVRTAATATWAASEQLSFNVSYGDTDRTPDAFYVGGAVNF